MMNKQAIKNNVDRIFERYTKPGSPGCVLAVVKDKEVIYKQKQSISERRWFNEKKRDSIKIK